MSTAEQVLVLLLAIALAVLLVLAIVAVLGIIKLVQSLRRIAQGAERAVHAAESAADVFKKTTTPLGVFSFVKQVINMATDAKDKKGKK